MDRSELALRGFRREHGLLWPDSDVRCAQVTFAEIDASWPKVMAATSKRGVAIQAGGNCGQLVRLMAVDFAEVYTFEPDPMNFVALTVNTADYRNVTRFQCALGDGPSLRGMANGDDKFPQNCGAFYMKGAGNIPTIRIDDLGLHDCDLIALDIEGAEAAALRGAAETIARCRPVIVIEEKGLGERFFSEAPEAAAGQLSSYRPAFKIKNDLIMVPQ